MRLDVSNLTVRYGDGPPAVDSVDLQVHDGEVLALLGPSGCGKSSILSAIAGLIEVDTASRIEVGGEDITHTPTHRRGVGLMFQSEALFPHMDVAGNVGFGCRMQGWTADAVLARVAETLELVGLSGMAQRDVTSLSGGEQQRVALARTIAPRPGVLMLDEPLSSIDRALREELLEELPDVFTRLDASVVYVTHDQHEALTLADTVAVMDAGRILQVGSPRTVWTAPANKTVDRFLGRRQVLAVDVRDGIATTPLGTVHVGGPDGPATAVVSAGAIRILSDHDEDRRTRW